MKLQKLTLHNIASIEDATIDFEAEPLASSEVFLITGKTGAGKSTLLDAICLALYADTPRLDGTRMQGDTQDIDNRIAVDDPRQLMRRNTAEASVSLTFTGSNGTHYSALWSVARARKKVTGNLQPKSWSLTNLDTGRTIEKDLDIKAEIKAAIGLDFSQFCRTTLLAQGEFTRFLNSKDDEKAAILEKITGVDIYTKVGKKVYELTSQKELLWKEAKIKVESTRTLTDEEVANLREKANALEVQYNELKASCDADKARQQWLKTDAELEKALVATREEYQKVQLALGGYLFDNQQRHEEALAALGLNDLRRDRDNAKELLLKITTALDRIDAYSTEKERRKKNVKALEVATAAIEEKQKRTAEMQPLIHDARIKMEACKEMLDRQSDTVNKFAQTLRQKLHIGDTCPVCRQTITTPLPHEEELAQLVGSLREAFTTAESAHKKLVDEKNRLDAEILTATQNYRTAKETLDNDKSVETAAQKVTLACRACGIETLSSDTPTLLKNLNDKTLATLNQLETKIKENEAKERLLIRVAKIAALLEDAVKRQEQHRLKKPLINDDETLLSLEKRINMGDKALAEISEKKGALNQALKTDAENRSQLGSLKEDADKKKADYQRWSRLNLLLGDATGNKFRKIAQSYILNSLIHSANSYLRTLTDRYTLRVTPGTFVILLEDAYQGYVCRAASTISGGESFLVSLALALALSDIGHQLSVDTLFIDEGFGTLSGEPLQNAIDTLRSLHTRSHRHVGIISHVEELQERIPVQIQVIQEGNNSSSTIKIAYPTR